MYTAGSADIAIIGAGHAGIEAGLAAARLGCEVAVFTINLDAVGNMPCNPAIGGTGKGQLVREIDALGGEMGYAADRVTLQSRILNAGKGPAVHSTRAQADRALYRQIMKETLEKANGVGLAAPQVGVLKRLFVISVNNCYFEVINPRIVKTCGKQTGPEGCLSVPNKFENVTRAKTVTIEFEDRFENKMTITASDLMARAFLHESDHLDGILYVDLLKKNKSVNV